MTDIRKTVLLASSALAFATAAHAQTAPAAVEEIVVTAERRSENLQKVPIAVAAVTAAGLAKAGIRDTNDLYTVTPGLQLNLSRNTLQTYLRGIGTQNTAGGEEGSIATYVDGVYVAALSGATLAFNNIERVEVLKGPQGTLFGRNATGGLIHVITRDPGFSPEARASIGYASYNTVTASGYVSGGLGDTVAMDLAGYFTNQGKGWGKNTSGIPGLNGTDVNYRDEWAVRSKLLFVPTDDLKFTFAADYSRRKSDIGNTRQIAPGAVAFGGVSARGSIYDSPQGTARDVDATTWGVSMKAEYRLNDDATLTATSAFRDYYDYGVFDQDAAPANLLTAPITYRTETFQQELLLLGTAGPVDYTAGVFYFSANAKADPLALRSDILVNQRLDRHSTQLTHSYAAFLQTAYRLSDTTRLTTGLRYTSDRREISGYDLSAPGYVGPIVGDPAAAPRPVGSIINSTRASTANPHDLTFNKVTWRLALDHQFTADLLGFASYSRGFKSGVFNTTTFNAAAVRPETLDAYEIGFKSDLLGRRLRLNGSAFHYDYKDIQLTSIQAGVTSIFNAARARVNGAELELIAAPPIATGALEVRGSVAWLDAKYKSFPGADFTQRNPVAPAPVGGICVGGVLPAQAGPATGNNTHCTGDASGNDMVRSPPVTFNVSANYELPVGDLGDLSFNVSYYYNGGFYFEPDNRFKQGAYGLLNAQVAFSAPGDRWSITGYARNLTKKTYVTGYTQGIGDVTAYGAPRTFGVTLAVKLP